MSEQRIVLIQSLPGVAQAHRRHVLVDTCAQAAIVASHTVRRIDVALLRRG